MRFIVLGLVVIGLLLFGCAGSQKESAPVEQSLQNASTASTKTFECPNGDIVTDSSKCPKPNCVDGTVYGECSSNKPKFCNQQLELVAKPSKCGCPEGMIYDMNGDNCIACGNGAVDAGETCSSCPADVKCSTGQLCCAGTCTTPKCSTPADCNDNDTKTGEACANAGTCNATCTHTKFSISMYDALQYCLAQANKCCSDVGDECVQLTNVCYMLYSTDNAAEHLIGQADAWCEH